MRLMEPLAPPGRYDAADPFGNYGARQYPHTGSDWNGVPAGTAAMAIGTGVVVNKQWHAGNGNTVTVKLPDGHYYAYLHLNAEAPVAVGQTVTIGQVIGYVGNTGTNSQGAHLHITVSDSPSAYAGLGNKIDPWQFIQDHKNDTDPVPPGEQEEDMSYSIVPSTDGTIYLCSLVTNKKVGIGTPAHVTLLQRYKKNNSNDAMLPVEIDIVQNYISSIKP
ncbi:M23 family metallopeptidase [Leifsonia sp. WHRI 6310E]|uniref:M23 family metallopeptidase n=1 Tax=Leifsonia sp. WHRI 6310E TaxID=3162562 RepID=UPI0032EFE7C8